MIIVKKELPYTLFTHLSLDINNNIDPNFRRNIRCSVLYLYLFIMFMV